MRLRWWEWCGTWRKAPGSIAAQAEGVERLVPMVLGVALLLLAAGVVLPLVTVKNFYIFTDRVSILDMIAGLWRDGEVFLSAVVFAFSIAFPSLKLLIADYVWRACPFDHHGTGRALGLLGWVGRWSMLDVFVLGLVVFSVKASGFASAESQPGLYVFAAAVALSGCGIWLLRRAERRLSGGGPSAGAEEG